MSTSERRRRLRGDEGFSLIEIVIAMGLLSAVMLASLPMLLSMLSSTVTTRLTTQAKNLSQERLEQLRGLRFHVDRQNGPFLDLLDLYYTNAIATGPVTTVPSGAGTLTGRYVAAGSAKGIAAPVYEVATGALSGATDFRQFVLAQFLAGDGSVLPASRFQGSYDSQDPGGTGVDAPPSLSIRFTVVTEWVQGGAPKELRATTVITDGQPEEPVIQTQAKGVAFSVGSTAKDGGTLELQGGLASLDGAQSSGSSVSGFVTGALATRTGVPAVSGQVGQFALPTQPVSVTGAGGAQNASPCSWFGFGPNSVTNATADIAAGLPKAPADVDAAGGPRVLTGSLARGTGNACGIISFDNLAGGGLGLDTTVGLGKHMGGGPYVQVPNGSTAGVGLSGSGYLTASPITATPRQARSGARVTMAEPAVIFPNSATTGAQGLVKARVSAGQVDCTSAASSTGTGTATGSYTLILEWWGKAPSDTATRWHTATYTYNSANSSALSISGDVWEPAVTDLGDGTKLSQLVQVTVPSATSGVLSTGATTGLRGFPNGVLTLTTASTLSNESGPGHSAIKVQLGQLSCVADDQR